MEEQLLRQLIVQGEGKHIEFKSAELSVSVIYRKQSWVSLVMKSAH